MAENKTVHMLYEELVKSGMSEKDAAKTAQRKTGIALKSGKPIKTKGLYNGKRNSKTGSFIIG